MRNTPKALRQAAARAKLAEPPHRGDPDMMTRAMTITADGGLMWDPRQPLQVLAPRMICKGIDGEAMGRIISLNIWTGDAIQVEGNDDGTHKYDENGHPILKHVRVSRVEIDIPPR